MKRSLFTECLRIAREHVPRHPQWDAYKHYSFVIQRNRIVEWGTNRPAEPLIGYPEHGKMHSECDAWFKARGLLEPEAFAIINIRLTKSGKTRLSKPCMCCEAFLRRFGCNEVWFSTESMFARMFI